MNLINKLLYLAQSKYFRVIRFDLRRELPVTQVRYVVIGLWNTLFGIGTFFFLWRITNESNYRLVLFLSFCLSNFQSHFTQRFFVWKSKNRYIPELRRFFVSAIGFFILNLLLLTFLVEVFKHPPFEVQVFLTFAIVVLSYFFQKYAVFKQTHEQP
jgi:putative flippase GtrA